MKKTAFTLAEILIVLGIIGIIAEMTIPTLMENVQKQEYVTALKKFYATQSDGWQRLLAEEGVEKLNDSDTFSKGRGTCWTVVAWRSDCSAFYNSLKKYFRFEVVPIPESYKPKYLNGTVDSRLYHYHTSGGDYSAIVFADGSMLIGEYIPSAGYTEKRNSALIEKIIANGGHLTEFQGDL